MNEKELDMINNAIKIVSEKGYIPDAVSGMIHSFNYEKIVHEEDRNKLWELFGTCLKIDSPAGKNDAAFIATSLMLPLIKKKYVNTIMVRDQSLNFNDFEDFFNECYYTVATNLPNFDSENYENKVAHFIEKPIRHTALDFDRPKDRSYYIEKKYNVKSQSYEEMFEAGDEKLMEAQNKSRFHPSSPEDIFIEKDNRRVTTLLFKACQIEENHGVFDKSLTKENAQMFAACHKFLGPLTSSFKQKAILSVASEYTEEKDEDIYY